MARAVRAVLDVVRDLVVGDDRRTVVGIVVVGIVVVVLLIRGGHAVGLPVWWLPTVMVTVLVVLGVGVSGAPPTFRRHRRR